jgi:hypothetical protein
MNSNIHICCEATLFDDADDDAERVNEVEEEEEVVDDEDEVLKRSSYTKRTTPIATTAMPRKMGMRHQRYTAA